jgi:hypothetical protein
LQLIVKRTRKAGADQKVELLTLEKFPEPFATSLFSDAGMQNLNFSISDDAANYPDAITIGARLIDQTPQETRAFRR